MNGEQYTLCKILFGRDIVSYLIKLYKEKHEKKRS